MHKLPVCFLALLVALTAIGCDSQDDDDSDADVFIGTWALVGLSDGDGDKTELFSAIASSLTATFAVGNTFSVLVDYREQPDFSLAGTYQLDEGGNILILQTAVGNPAFDYVIESDTRMMLSAPADVINGLFQTEIYTGIVTITVAKQ